MYSFAYLPKEIAAHTASLLPNQSELLALRSASSACRDVVVCAIKIGHKECTQFKFLAPKDTGLLDYEITALRDPAASPQRVEALGKVFGGGVRQLKFEGASARALSALSSFVTSTQGRLTELVLWNCSITAPVLVEICRECPQLKRLSAKWKLPNVRCLSVAKIEDLAGQIGAACPMLQRVKLPSEGLSPVETYASYFPQLRSLEFSPDLDTLMLVAPTTRLDSIQLAAECCTHAVDLNFHWATVSPALVLLATSLRDRVTRLELGASRISEAAVFQCARGMPALRTLLLPAYFVDAGGNWISLEAGFYRQLYQARPTLDALRKQDEDNHEDDECMRAISQFPLRMLELTDMRNMDASAIVPILIDSNCSATLREARFNKCDAIGVPALLRLARACPHLANVSSNNYYLTPMDPAIKSDVMELDRLLKSREGKFYGCTRCMYVIRGEECPF